MAISPQQYNEQPQLLRLDQVLALYPVSRSTWFKGIKSGIYPKGVKVGKRITMWRKSDIQALIDSVLEGGLS